jgi:transcriptional regulator with XRE-family HTH domain
MITPLRFYRMGQNITVSELAKKTQVSVSLISKIENGFTCGSKKTRLKISKVLNIPEKNIFGGK